MEEGGGEGMTNRGYKYLYIWGRRGQRSRVNLIRSLSLAQSVRSFWHACIFNGAVVRQSAPFKKSFSLKLGN